MQIRTQGLAYFKRLMGDFVKGYLENKSFRLSTVFSCNVKKVYVTKSPVDNYWYRVKIVKFENQFEVLVNIIDFGGTLVVKKRNMILLEDLSKVLANFPDQASFFFFFLFVVS